MLFSEALSLLKEGKSVSRECWKQEDGYLVFMKGMRHVWKILTHPTPNAGNHIFSVEELCADDWVEFCEEKFAQKQESDDMPDAA